MLNEWRPVPGYGGKYEASFLGQIRRIYKTKPPKVLSQYERKHQKGSRRLYVKMTKDGETGKDVCVAQVIYTTWKGPIPEGYIVYHKNGCFMDNIATNLEIASRKIIGRKTGARSRKKSVVKISAGGEYVDVYFSAREAGRQNFMSYQTIIDRCNGLVKKRPAPDGFDYAWEDNKTSVRKALERLGCKNGTSVKD